MPAGNCAPRSRSHRLSRCESGRASTGRGFREQAPWLAIFPGIAISLAVLAGNLFGDTLRDAWNPKLRRNG